MKRTANGFTLIEVLVVLVLSGLILLLLGQGTQIVTRGMVTYHRTIQPQSDMEPVERALRQLIRHMDPGRYPEPTVIRGTAHTLAFVTELPDPDTAGTMIADVRLEVNDGRLVLTWQRQAIGVRLDGVAPVRQEVLMENVSGMDIAYAPRWTNARWLSAWNTGVMPGLIKLSVKSGNRRSSWPAIVERPWREQAEE